ncbi:hypothetical protein HPP92_007811 [Vanilla planifolia]|uniref:Uncharacterized protein n=1 Tax=Vanilla planifolia TaxID=51239 RepID=A0A835RIW1_VANPL|nr:hypothetical protein HPP92_007811 [Vanilla planifolia]
MEDYVASTGRDSSSSLYGSIPANSYYLERCGNPLSGENSPCNMSPWHHSVPGDLMNGAGSYADSNWSMTSIPGAPEEGSGTCLIGSLVREEGHIYSLTAVGPLLYTGSDSKNIRVWKNQKEYAAFKSSSGLVKAIIIAGGDRILTGHQDGKIRVWRISPKDPTVYKRIGSLPRLKDFIKYSLKPSNYVEVRRHRSALWIRHCDAVSCLSFVEEQGLLYSGSWDRTFKVWRISDSKCLESVVAHDDAVNSVVAASFDGLVFTGSADGTVKVWRRELQGKGSKHKQMQTLLKQDSAVTALVISPTASVVYSGSSDGIINFWEWERQLSHSGVLRGHKLAVLCLAAAGSLVLSGSADKTICVWRRDGGVHSCLSVLTGHSGPVKCLAIEEECAGNSQEASALFDRSSGPPAQRLPFAAGRGARFIVYSGSLDKSVKVWRVSEQAPEALLRGPQYVTMDPNV